MDEEKQLINLIEKFRYASYESGYYSGVIETMVNNNMDTEDIEPYRKLHKEAIEKRQQAESILKLEVL